MVEEKFKLHRYSSTPIETYGVIADYDEASFEKIVAKMDISKHRLMEWVILQTLNAKLMGQ